MRPLQKISAILFTIVLLPALVFLATRISALSENERLIATVYDDHLETLLFSINQYAWEVTSDWARALEQDMERTSWQDASDTYLRETPRVAAVFVADTAFTTIQGTGTGWHDGVKETVMTLPPQTVRRLAQRKAVGYQQLEPLMITQGTDGTTMALLFLTEVQDEVQVAGLVLDVESFITTMLAPKLEEISRDRFVIGVFHQYDEQPLIATGTLARSDARQERRLWFLEDYTLGIRLQGMTIEDALARRFERDLLLIVLVALVLLGAAWMLYRNIRREMALSRIKSEFVANVSHELRTPLSLIRMYAETLELNRVPSEEHRHTYYRIISQETERLSRLVNNILNFSRIEAGRKKYAFRSVALDTVVSEVLERYTFTLEQQGFGLETSFTADLPRIQGDREAITEAVINLLDNAMKYSTDTKQIRIATGQQGRHVFIEVADQGIGIAKKDQAHIFEQFYRAAPSLVHDTKGTGLGLSLVYHIMEAHEGTVNVESQPGKGSRFRLLFPLVSTTNSSSTHA